MPSEPDLHRQLVEAESTIDPAIVRYVRLKFSELAGRIEARALARQCMFEVTLLDGVREIVEARNDRG